MKVLYITNIPSPYKVDYYNELGKYCELTALFEAETSTERSEEWKKYRFETFEGIILKGKRVSVDTAFCPEIVKYLQKGRYDIVVLTVLASPTALLAVHTLRRRKIPYYYEGDGGFAKEASGIKATLKRYLISAAGKCFSSSNEFDLRRKAGKSHPISLHLCKKGRLPDRETTRCRKTAQKAGIRHHGKLRCHLRGTIHSEERNGSITGML